VSETVNLAVGAVAVLSIAGFVAGLALCASYEWRTTGRQTAFASLALFIFVFSFVFFQKKVAESNAASVTAAAAEQAYQGAVQPAPAVPTYQDVLSKLRVGSLSPSGRRNTWTANFLVHNDSNIAIKDVRVVCEQFASSGTPVRWTSRTLYEIVGRRSYISVNGMNLGPRHSDAKEPKCFVAGFSFI
jgi:hypothetical protein